MGSWVEGSVGKPKFGNAGRRINRRWHGPSHPASTAPGYQLAAPGSSHFKQRGSRRDTCWSTKLCRTDRLPSSSAEYRGAQEDNKMPAITSQAFAAILSGAVNSGRTTCSIWALGWAGFLLWERSAHLPGRTRQPAAPKTMCLFHS